MAARKKPEEKSWEERVMALEASANDLSEKLGATQGELASAKAKLAAASAALEAHKQAEAAREEQAFAAFLGDLKQQATQAGSAIGEDKLATVAETWKAGNKDLAKTLAGAYLDLAKATGGGAVRGDQPQLVKLGASGQDTNTKTAYRSATLKRWGMEG